MMINAYDSEIKYFLKINDITRDVRWRLNIDITMVNGQVKRKFDGRWWFDGDMYGATSVQSP